VPPALAAEYPRRQPASPFSSRPEPDQTWWKSATGGYPLTQERDNLDEAGDAQAKNCRAILRFWVLGFGFGFGILSFELIATQGINSEPRTQNPEPQTRNGFAIRHG